VDLICNLSLLICIGLVLMGNVSIGIYRRHIYRVC